MATHATLKGTGPSFCWVCRKPLEVATTGVERGRFVFSVVVDPIGAEHRAHKVCGKRTHDRDGERNPWHWVRDETADRTEP